MVKCFRNDRKRIKKRVLDLLLIRERIGESIEGWRLVGEKV